jgi:hypothetical protein
MRAALGISMLALVLSTAGAARAQDGAAEPTPAQVRVAAEAFDKGREAYQAEEYVEAAEQFEKADYNAPSVAALELAARSRDKAGELARAATLASLGVKRYPEEQNLLRLAGDLAKRARVTLFELTATCDTPCELTVGGKLIHGQPDTQRVMFVLPGAVTVRAGWSDNRSDSRQVQAEAGGSGEVSFSAPPLPEVEAVAKEPVVAPRPAPAEPSLPPEETDAKSAGWSPVVFYAGAGITAVLTGVTVWSGIDTLNNPGKNRVREACSSEACQLYQDGVGRQHRTNALIGVTLGVGAATALVGLFATDWSGKKSAPQEAAKRSRPRVDVLPWASVESGGLQAFGRF